jgi:hypothetical protein
MANQVPMAHTLILTNCQTEIERIMVLSQPQAKVSETPSQGANAG